jgi:hypothetical protein
MSDDRELKVIASASFEDIEVREPMSKSASGRSVADVDHGQSSGKEAYGRNLETAIDFLWRKVRENITVDPSNKTSVEHAAAYYSMIDNAISSIVTADAAGEISHEDISRLDEIRSAINDRHRVILASVVSQHRKPSEDGCYSCGSPLFEERCVVCGSNDGQMIKEAGSPKLDFHESGFIVGLATDISNYVITSGMNLNDAIKIARDSFNMTAREEYRLRKYLGYMGHMAPQMIWLPAAEVRHS